MLRKIGAAAFCLMFSLAGSGPAFAQTIPALKEIPVGSAQSRADLVRERGALVDERNTLRESARQQRERCHAVAENSAAWSACDRERASLASQIQAHVARSDRFNGEIDALDSPSPTFDPRTLITGAEYDYALSAEKKLNARRQRLQDELKKLRTWQQGLEADRAEFAEIQSEAQVDYLNDVFAAIPAGEVFGGFAARNLITPQQAGALAAGYDALKGFFAGAEGLANGDNGQQLEKILKAQTSLREAMLAPSMAKLEHSGLAADQASYRWLGNVGKTYDAAIELIVFLQQKDHTAEAAERLILQLGVVAVPLANFIVIGDTLFEKHLTRSIVQQPLDSLDAAMSKNFDARRYLNEKLDSVNYELAGVQETVKNYRAVHGGGRAAPSEH